MAAEMWRNFRLAFWSETLWLPPNTTWADVDPDRRTDIRLTDYRHLIWPVPLALFIFCVRIVFERYWFSPVGVSLGIKCTRPKKAPVNPVLEKAYNSSKHLRHKTKDYEARVQGLAKQLDWTERQVERWLRLRRIQDKPSTLVKFCENSWRCLYYSFAFAYGVIVLWDKPWLWDINECWTNYPYQSVTDDIWWYYMFEMAFYWSLCVSQFFDVKRKDFWQMFVHHIATNSLMCLSWICNFYRIGTLVLLVHDCADIFLEAAKMAKYAGYQKLCDTVFAIFTVLWVVTRLGFFPIWIIHNINVHFSTSIYAPMVIPMFHAYYIFNGLLLTLLVLHVFWTYLILKIAWKAVSSGEMQGDIRSSSSDYSDEASH